MLDDLFFLYENQILKLKDGDLDKILNYEVKIFRLYQKSDKEWGKFVTRCVLFYKGSYQESLRNFYKKYGMQNENSTYRIRWRGWGFNTRLKVWINENYFFYFSLTDDIFDERNKYFIILRECIFCGSNFVYFDYLYLHSAFRHQHAICPKKISCDNQDCKYNKLNIFYNLNMKKSTQYLNSTKRITSFKFVPFFVLNIIKRTYFLSFFKIPVNEDFDLEKKVSKSEKQKNAIVFFALEKYSFFINYYYEKYKQKIKPKDATSKYYEYIWVYSVDKFSYFWNKSIDYSGCFFLIQDSNFYFELLSREEKSLENNKKQTIQTLLFVINKVIMNERKKVFC